MARAYGMWHARSQRRPRPASVALEHSAILGGTLFAVSSGASVPVSDGYHLAWWVSHRPFGPGTTRVFSRIPTRLRVKSPLRPGSQPTGRHRFLQLTHYNSRKSDYFYKKYMFEIIFQCYQSFHVHEYFSSLLLWSNK